MYLRTHMIRIAQHESPRGVDSASSDDEFSASQLTPRIRRQAALSQTHCRHDSDYFSAPHLPVAAGSILVSRDVSETHAFQAHIHVSDTYMSVTHAYPHIHRLTYTLKCTHACE